MRKVRDRTGAITWRKMETRVILARADDVDPATGADPPERAVRHVHLERGRDVRDVRLAALSRPGSKSRGRDVVRTYITDELLYQTILDTTTGTVDGAVAQAIKDHADDPAYRDLLQHYAIPGKIRCVQCHMGSPTKDFVLGFLPLQVKRRATGTGRDVRRDGRPTS